MLRVIFYQEGEKGGYFPQSREKREAEQKKGSFFKASDNRKRRLFFIHNKKATRVSLRGFGKGFVRCVIRVRAESAHRPARKRPE